MSTISVLTIYPTALKVEEVLKARARAGDPSLGHRLTTFPELIETLDREAGGPPVLSDALALVLVHRALADEGGDRAIEHPGLATRMLRALGELKAACLAPEAIARLAGAAAPDAARQRLAWIGRVAIGYAARLREAGRADRHDRERRVLAMLERHVEEGTRPRVLVDVERLVIAEIYDYSPAQSLIARALIRLVGDAQLVTLAHPENVDASRFVELTWDRFVEDPAVADKVLPDFVVRGGRAGTLTRVLANVFVEPKPLPLAASDGRVRIVAAPSRMAEVEEVGRRVGATLEAGAAPERIAILARTLQGYRPLLEDVARRQGLPLAFREPRPLIEHGSVQAALRMLHAIADGLPRDVLVAALESPYFSRTPPRARAVLAAVGYVDAATVPLAQCLASAERRGAEGGASQVRPRFADEHGARLAETVQRLAALERPRAVSTYAVDTRRLLHELGWTLPGTDRVVGEAPGEGPALAALDRLLADLSEDRHGARPMMTLARFLALLEAAVDLVEVDAPGASAAGVRVLAIADARGLDFDDVFLLGLDDGTFPAPVAEDGMLPDGVRRVVNRHGPPLVLATLGPVAAPGSLGRLLRERADRAAEDPFLFYLALSTAEERVVVTYPTRDDDGNALVRSPFVDELTTVVGRDAIEVAASPTAVERCDDRGELLNVAVAAAIAGRPEMLAAAGAGLPGGALARLLARMRTERRRARYFLLDRARDAEAKESLADAFVGRLGPETGRGARLRAARWSPTALDELGACGFRFFARRVLRLRDETTGAEVLDGREQGILVHRLLEAVLGQGGPVPPRPAAAAEHARTVAASLRATIAAELRPADPRLFDLAWDEAVDAVAEVLAAEAEAPERRDGTRRRFLERRFEFTIPDHRGGPAAARLDVTVDGTLDRADVWLDGSGQVVAARVLDYKNAKREREYAKRLDPAGALGTMSFQLPLYAMGLRTAPDLAWSPEAEIEGGYVLVRGGRKALVRPIAASLLTLAPEARAVDPEDAVAAGGAVPIANRVVDLVADALEGRFDVEPRECSRYCAYRHVCRYEPPPEEDE